MELANIHPQYVTNEEGNRTAVILTIEEYNSIIEDLEDLALVAARVNESVTPHEEFMDELRQDGLV